jgi:branched-chain amino acid transport system permease protein
VDGAWDFLFGSPAFLTFGLYTVVMVIGLSLLLHLQMGLAGIGNFGVVGFWGVGMYCFGVLIVTYEWPYLAALLAASALAGVAGVAVGWLIADLDTDGVLGATLSFATIVFLLADGERDLTGGQVGLGTIDFPFDFGARTDVVWLAILAAIVGGLLYYVYRVHRSPYGRLLIAVGDNEALARSLGKTTSHSKVVLLALSSAAMGLLGALYASMSHFLFPSHVDVRLTIAVVVALVLGGSRRPLGSIVGALLTVGLFDVVIKVYVRLPPDFAEQAYPKLQQMVYGALLVVLLLFRPLGLLGDMRRDRLSKRVGDG